MNSSRFYAMDGLKGISAFGIAFLCTSHGYRFMPEGLPFMNWTRENAGYLVELFAMMSGFMMAYKYKDRIKDLSFFSYMKKRTSRLLPIYWFTTTIALVMQIVFKIKTGGTFPVARPLSFFVIVQQYLCMSVGWFGNDRLMNGPLWFINCLILCYIIYFMLVKVSHEKKDRYFLLLFCWMLIGGAFLYQKKQIPFFIEDSCRCYMSFALGAIIYEFHSSVKEDSYILRAITFTGGGYIDTVTPSLQICFWRRNADDVQRKREACNDRVLLPLHHATCSVCSSCKMASEQKIIPSSRKNFHEPFRLALACHERNLFFRSEQKSMATIFPVRDIVNSDRFFFKYFFGKKTE